MPHVTIAYRTIQAIDEMVRADQGAKYRGILKEVLPHINDAYRTDEEDHRSHMGASVLGQECGRAVWYNFRWATKSNFEGRIIRLFNRGHIEEGRFIALLLMLGVQLFQQDEQGNQYRISFADGHGGGSGDGVAIGIPDLPPETAALVEFKTHGETSFIELAGKLIDWRAHLRHPSRNPFTGKGVREAKFEHYVQMQLYMFKMGLAAAIYMAIDKNTDDIYAEIVVLDSAMAEQFIARGEKIVWMDEPPTKINPSPGFYKCRFCDHRPVCHLRAAPDRNCRTCINSEPRPNAEWYCRFHQRPIDKPEQLTGCNAYVADPRIYG